MRINEGHPDYYRARAAEARARAKKAKNAPAWQDWIEIAANWERLANGAEHLANQRRSTPAAEAELSP